MDSTKKNGSAARCLVLFSIALGLGIWVLINPTFFGTLGGSTSQEVGEVVTDIKRNFMERDCISSYTKEKVAIVVQIPKSFSTSEELPIGLDVVLTQFREFVTSRSVDMYTAQRFIIMSPNLYHVVARSEDPIKEYATLLHYPEDYSEAGHQQVADVVRGRSGTPYILVIPLGYEFHADLRMYNFLKAMDQDHKVVTSYMDKYMSPPARCCPLLPWLAGPSEFNGKWLSLALPNVKSNNYRRLIPEKMRWFVTTWLGSHYSDKQRNERLPELLCPKDKKPFWRCHDVSPVFSQNPEAYMGKDCPSEFLSEKLTILITAHLAPSNPNPFLVKVLLQSLHMMPELRHVRKLIVYDGPKPGSEERHRLTLQENQKLINQGGPLGYNTEILALNSTQFLQKVTEFGLKHVSTPYVLILQPDLPFLRAAQMYLLVNSMITYNQLYVRFARGILTKNKFDNNLENIPASLVPLARTNAFSSENHLARTEIYEQRIFPAVNKGKFGHWAKSHCKTVECFMNKQLPGPHMTRLLYNVYDYIGHGPYSVHLDGSERHEKIPAELLDQLSS